MSNEVSRPGSETPVQTGQQGETTRGAPVYRPLTDIRESGQGVIVAMEMPGVGPDDVEIELERRTLTIRGRGRVPSPEGFRRIYTEYGEGDYERVFTVSEDIDEAKIKATMRDGVLTLELPRAEAAKPKKIKVSAS